MFNFSEKALDLIATPSRVDILEGVARSGKSAALRFKFGLKVDESPYSQFIIAGATAVIARRNLIDCDDGFMSMFAGYVREGTDPKKGNHLIFKDSSGKEKLIYIVGFKDKARWEVLLGSTIGALLVDEINLADPAFIAQAFRSGASIDGWYFGATLNPANPDLEIYETLINRCRPLKKWSSDVPGQTIEQIKTCKQPIITNAIYWFFNFKDNPIMTDDKVKLFSEMYPEDSVYFLSLILGLRCVAEGVIFGKYLNEKHDIDLDSDEYWQDKFIKFTFGIDLGNNEIKRGTILTFNGVGRKFDEDVIIDAYECESTEANALVEEIGKQLKSWYDEIKNINKIDGIYIDGYGAIQILIPTIRKKVHELTKNDYLHVDLALKFGDNAGRMARMMLMLLMINQYRLKFNKRKGAQEVKKHLKRLVYAKDGLPLDENRIENDYYDSACYSITPFLPTFNEVLKPKV